MNRYHCDLCGKTVERDSEEERIRSYCTGAERLTWITRVEEEK